MEVVAADVDSCLKATELRLGLPGTEEKALPTPPSTPRGKKREGNTGAEEAAKKRDSETAPPAAKAQVVGWPPVRSYRKSCFQQSSSSATKTKPAPAPEEKAPPAAGAGSALFVKVSMDGAPYLRKVDLKMYKGYRELREALEAMFLGFSGGAADAPAVNQNTERRIEEAAARGILYLGMGVSGGEEGARNGPSLMPGGHVDAYNNIRDILEKAAAQTEDGACVTFVGPGGAGNFVKMVHNGIEYGDMQLIAEAYDVLRRVGGLSNSEIADVFDEWNKGELESFLVEITADIFTVADPLDGSGGALVDKILDKTGMKGTGKWTVQQAAELAVAAPTIAASLDGRYLSGLKDERVAAAGVLEEEGMPAGLLEKINVDKKVLVDRVRQALYASKICSYAQGMNLIRAKSVEKGWNLNLAELARIWKGGCIIRARFLDRIKRAYDRNPELANLIVDREFAREMVQRQNAWRWVVARAVEAGISTPGMTASLSYFDTYRSSRLPANLIQAQRDLFGAHTYERIDRPGSFHTEWTKLARRSNGAAI